MGLRIRKIIFPIALFVADILVVYASFIFAYWLRFISGLMSVVYGIPSFGIYHRAIFVVIFLWILIFLYTGFYNERKLDILNEFLRILKGVFLGTIVVAAMTFLYRDFTFSRIMLSILFIVSSLAIFISHEIIRVFDVYLGNMLLGTHKILVVGTGKIADDIKKILKHRKNFEIHFLHDTNSEHVKGFIIKNNVNEVIFSKECTAHAEMVKISNICEDMNVDFRFVPDILELTLGEVVIDEFLGIPVFRIKVVQLHGWNFYIKRFMDIVLSLCFISIAIIPLLVIALIIKLEDGGPVFYKHKRKGYRGRDFDFIKFRTMVSNADKILKEIRHLSERQGPVFKMRDDPRITKIGKLLRKFSIDEMPQFINVLRGEMSIVGPRPQVLWEAEHYDDIAKRRLKVLPGITGLWQVRGRSDLSYEEMIRLDIYYLENWSVALDIRIIVQTIPAILTQKGAY
jgi:exopolysaccharide biosynthesis polyprenyl glycosylphosphotransferase